MMNQPSGNFETDQTKSGEDWWYSLRKIYDANENHIGYVTVGYSNFVNQPYNNTTECKTVEIETRCDDFHAEDMLQGATYQTVGLFDLSGKMYRCKTFNLGHFWDIIQSADRTSLIAVGYTDNTMDQHPTEWSGRSDGFLIYNPTLTNNPTTSTNDILDHCSEGSQRKLSIVKMTMTLSEEWNYLYGAPDYSSYTKEEIRNNVKAWGFSIDARSQSGQENYAVVGNSYPAPGNTNDAAIAYVVEVNPEGYINWTHTPLPASSPTIASSAQAVYKSANGLL